jgi:hypothetical protein
LVFELFVVIVMDENLREREGVVVIMMEEKYGD